MKTTKSLFAALLVAAATAGSLNAGAQTVVLTEDFSAAENIFGITATGLANNSASIYDSGLDGYGKVLTVMNSTAEGAITDGSGQPVAADGVMVTAEWDVFHGWYGTSKASTVSLLNSNGDVIAAYTYDCSACQVNAVTIGNQQLTTFQAFGFQNRYTATSGANGWQGGSKGQKYVATEGFVPHVAVSLTPQGIVKMVFTLNGTSTTVGGSAGQIDKNIATIRVQSAIDNSDRCYGLDNIKVTTEEVADDPDYVEPIVSVSITGAERMTFGPSPDEAYENPYSVTVTGGDGTVITGDNVSEKVTDFSVAWDIEGFKTENDTEGQYCDSYGTFSVNNAKDVATTFDLRDVPMNFFGKMTATVTYNGEQFVAEKYVVAQGSATPVEGQVIPLPGYPADFSAYPAALDGYRVAKETYGSRSDLILGGWCVAGSDSHEGVVKADADGTVYVRVNAPNMKKSHVITQNIASPEAQLIFTAKLRFNNAGAVVTFTGGYPFWSASKYTCPVTLSFNGSKLTLNGTELNNGGAAVTFSTAVWYQVVLSADKSSQTCYAMIFAADGTLLATSGLLPWSEDSTPTYFSVGMGNSVTGSVDLGGCTAYVPAINADSYTLTADKTTLSIPQGETATLVATATDTNGYDITQQAIWAVVEEDMLPYVTITPAEGNSQQAVLSVSEDAPAGAVTVQVSIGGMARTLALTLTTSSESIKFTQSTTSITIPLDADKTEEARFEAVVIDGQGNDLGRTVTLQAYDKTGLQPYTFGEGIAFDAATGLLTVGATAVPAQFCIRATGKNSDDEELTNMVRVNVHGMKFDFGNTTDDGVAEGFTAVGPATAYSAASGYGIVQGTATVQGTASDTDAESDWLQGAVRFDFKVMTGDFYKVEITYQGVLTTGVINSDLTGYELGTRDAMGTDTFVIPATTDVIDLHIAANDATSVAAIAKVVVTKEAKRQKRQKRVVHHIGDSTSANNGSWAYSLSKNYATQYPELAELCDFQNNGAGGRNLSTYYAQGKLAAVLRDIYPDDVVMFGNNGTNGMGSSFEADVNYYLDAAEALGAKIIINSYTPHGAVSNYSSGYNASTHTFNSYRKDSYETVVRRVAAEREQSDASYLGFVEIGMNADAIFNAYVADYAANGYASADAAAQAIISCFTDHNHYNNGTLACNLMLAGYATAEAEGIVAQMVKILEKDKATTPTDAITVSSPAKAGPMPTYTLSGQKVDSTAKPGIYVRGGRKFVVK